MSAAEEELAELLAEAARLEGVPERVRQDARAAFAMRPPAGAEVAELVFDSDLDTPEPRE